MGTSSAAVCGVCGVPQAGRRVRVPRVSTAPPPASAPQRSKESGSSQCPDSGRKCPDTGIEVWTLAGMSRHWSDISNGSQSVIKQTLSASDTRVTLE